MDKSVTRNPDNAPTVDALIAEVRELDAKATPGPWQPAFPGIDDSIHDPVVSLEEKGGPWMEYQVLAIKQDDVTFIARSRTLLVQLADALERADNECAVRHEDTVVLYGRAIQAEEERDEARQQLADTTNRLEFIDSLRLENWDLLQAKCVEVIELQQQLAEAQKVVDAARSVLSEDGVREQLSCYVRGVELIELLEEKHSSAPDLPANS
jgi:DNA-dependent RNA polymerase auxiliary subunit epsilon